MVYLIRFFWFVAYLIIGLVLSPIVAVAIFIKGIPDVWGNIVLRIPTPTPPTQQAKVTTTAKAKKATTEEPEMPPIFYPKIGNC